LVDSFYVYIITTDKNWPTKIGVAFDCKRRLYQLQTANWAKLRVYSARAARNWGDARKIESKAHAMLIADGRRLRGEWFDIAPEVARHFVVTAAALAKVKFIKNGA